MVKTAQTNKAVKVPTPEVGSRNNIQTSVRWHIAKTHPDLMVHSHAIDAGAALLIWAEARRTA